MSKKYLKMILSVAVIGLIPPYISHASLTDMLPDSWKQWIDSFSKTETANKETPINTEVTENQDGSSETQNDPEKPAEPVVDFYSTLGIKLFPEKYLLGKESVLKKHLVSLFETNNNRKAVAFFVSLEKKRHDVALSILETLPAQHRLKLLLESPPAFIAKLFVGMRNIDFKGKTLSHWGPFELQSDYFGTMKVETGQIMGESISLRYISFLLSYNPQSKVQKLSGKEFATRVVALAKILSFASGSDLSSLLVYSHEEVVVKLGLKHEDCYGDVQTKGSCEEETAIYLPEDFVGQFLNLMHNQKLITKKDLVSILEAEFKLSTKRFQLILKWIAPEVLQDVAYNFSEEIIAYLPDEIILGAMPTDEDTYDELPAIDVGPTKVIIKDSKNSTNNTIQIPSNNDDSSDKDDL